MLNKHYLTVILTVIGLSNFGFASVNALPPTVSGNTIVCQGATTTLTASAAGTNVTYRWYDALIGGNLLSTNNPYTTAPLNATTTIYVESVEGGIPSLVRTPVLLVVLPNLDVPVGLANPTITCPGDDIVLTGTSITGSTIFNWYDALTGGNLLFTGAVFNTTVAATTIFYLETVNGDGCASVRTPTVVTVLPNLDIPVGTATPAIICPGENVHLEGTSILGATVFNWYDQITGGTLLHTGQTYDVNPSSTTTYFLETYSGIGCPSIRTPVLVTALPNLDIPVGTATPPTICPGENTQLSGTSILGATTFNWYDQITGGTLLHTGQTYDVTPSNTTTYYLETTSGTGCNSVRTPVIVAALPNLDVPVGIANPPLICPGQNTQLSATSLVGATTFNWYDQITGGTLLHTGQTYDVTPNSSTTYFLESTTGTGCNSVRTPVIVTAVPNLDIPIATASSLIVCPGDTTHLLGASINGSTIYEWFSDSLGNNLIGNVADLVVTPLVTTIYYLATTNANGCRSILTPIVITVIPNIDVPIGIPDPLITCPGQPVTLTAASITGETNFNWFDDALDPYPIATGPTYTTTVNSTQTFHVSSVTASGCQSLRTPVLVTVLPNLDVPLATATDLIVCPGDSTTLMGNSLNGSTIFEWYSDSLGNNLLANTVNYIVTPVVTTVFYLLSVDANGCKSILTPIVITVLPNIDVPLGIANPTISCGDVPVNFEGTSVTGNTTFNWYAQLTSTTPEYTGQIYTTTISSTTIKYLETESAAGCKSIRVPVIAIVTPNLDVPIGTASDLFLCPGDSTTLTGNSINGSTIFEWYSDSMGNNLLANTVNYVVAPVVTTVYYLLSVNANGCKSILTPVLINVLPNLDVPLAVANPPIVCPNEQVTFEGTSITGSTIFNWYDSPLGGNLLHTGQNYTTNVMGNLTVYLETENATGCTSLRTPAVVVVVPNIDVPVATANPLAVCPGDSVTLSATSLIGSSTFYWYDDLFDSIPMYVGNDYTVLAGDTSQIFHVESESAEGCRSIRTPVTMIVNKNDDNPLVTGAPLIGCIGDTAFLVGVSLNGSVGYNWYDTIVGGSPVGSGILFSPTLSANKTYYLETVNLTGCKSKRTPINLSVSLGDVVVLGTTQDTTVCEGSVVNIQVSSLSGLGLTLFFDLPQNGNVLGQGLNYVTGPILSDTSFFVQALDSLLCPGDVKEISINVLDSIKLDSPQMNCSPDDNAVIFTWDNVPYADGYEVGLNSNSIWTPIGANTFYEVTNLEAGQDVTLFIRATYSGTADCITPESDEISVSCRSDEEDLILPYNTFSPNNDGKNDWWNVGNGITKHSDNEVRIFNRIGEEVFSTVGYNDTNNVFRGDGLATGSYYYVVTVPSIDFQQTGFLILTR